METNVKEKVAYIVTVKNGEQINNLTYQGSTKEEVRKKAKKDIIAGKILSVEKKEDFLKKQNKK